MSAFSPEEEDAVATLPPSLAMQLSARTGARFHSASGSRLALFARGRPEHGQPALADFAWDACVSPLAPLLHGWHTIFAQLQSAAVERNPRLNPAADTDAWHAQLLTTARAYRAELEACLIAAAQQIQTEGPEKNELKRELAEKNIAFDDYKYQLLLLETCKSLFHLLEIFYLDPHLNLTAQLIDWIHRTLQTPVVELLEAEMEQGMDTAVMVDNDSYWSCVYRMLLQGRLYEAMELLRTCDELVGKQSEYYDVMRQVMDAISTVPAIAYRQQAGPSNTATNHATDDDATNIPLDQFLASFQQWRRGVQAIMNGETLRNAPHPHLEMLLLVLLGDEQSLLSAAQSNYLEYFIATLIYVKPTVQNSKQEMSTILETCMTQCEEQWRQYQRDAKAQMEEQDDTAATDTLTDEEIESSTLYTPIDTLRYHLISSDIASALSLMSTLLDLKFFLAHVVNLLDAHGEIIHLEPQQDDRPPLPLRLKHSTVNDDITLKEFHLITYGQDLEAAAAAPGSNAATDDLWQLAVEYYATCPENGRGYLTHLLRKQSLTLTLGVAGLVAPGGSAFQVAPIVPARVLQTKKVHKLLAIASRFDLTDEYNHIVTMAGNVALDLGKDALAAAATATVATKSTAYFGQAAFWYNMLQPSNGRAVATQTVAKLEAMAEFLLDQLLLKGSTLNKAQEDAALHAVVGILAHAPEQLVVSLESLDTATLASGGFSALLSFLGAYHSFRLFEARRQQVVRDLQVEKARAREEAATIGAVDMLAEDERMDVDSAVGAPSADRTATLSQLLTLQAYFHEQALGLVVLMLRHAPTLLASHRKYWLVLIALLVDLGDARATSKQAASGSLATPAPVTSWFDLQHPSVSLSALPTSPSSLPLTLGALTHTQRLLTSLLHSNTAALYSEPVGGPQATKRLQQRLADLTQRCIGRA